MKKVCILAFTVLAFACSDEPEQPGCASDLSAIQLAGTAVYTGETISFEKPTLCTSDELTVLVNGQEVPLTEGDDGALSFTVPTTAESTATIKVRAGESEVSFGPVSVIKAYGTWKAVASFTGSGRLHTEDFSTTTDGYLYGGTSFSGETTTFHNDLYKYNAAANTWTKVATHDNFEHATEAFLDDKLYLPGTKYSVADNAFTPVSGINYKGSGYDYWTTQYFTNKGSVYAISDINLGLIEIQKYNTGNNTWSVVKELPYKDKGEPNYFSFNFAVEHDGITYIGILFQNNTTIDVWAFDGANNSFTKVSSVVNDIAGSTQDLKHLFTLNDLGYFMDRRESSEDVNGKVEIIEARDYLYVYNFATSEWHKVKTEYPENMYGAGSFNIGNRGFAGLGAKEGTTTGLVFSQKFYEFVPAQ